MMVRYVHAFNTFRNLDFVTLFGKSIESISKVTSPTRLGSLPGGQVGPFGSIGWSSAGGGNGVWVGRGHAVCVVALEGGDI